MDGLNADLVRCVASHLDARSVRRLSACSGDLRAVLGARPSVDHMWEFVTEVQVRVLHALPDPRERSIFLNRRFVVRYDGRFCAWSAFWGKYAYDLPHVDLTLSDICDEVVSGILRQTARRTVLYGHCPWSAPHSTPSVPR